MIENTRKESTCCAVNLMLVLVITKENKMTANINAAPKNHAFTLIYLDNETKEVFSHQFMSSDEELYGDELKELLLLPAAEIWLDFNKGTPDMEEVKNIAETLTALAVVYGHPQVEEAAEKAAVYNPLLDIFGKRQLRLVH